MKRAGVDVGGTKIEAVMLDEDGRELARKRIATPRGDYQGGIESICSLLADIETMAGAMADRIGVGIPGTISPATGLIKNANSTWMIGRPFDRDLAAALGRPVRLANDANCFAVSEATDGAAAGERIVFGVILGTGVGGGIVVDGVAWEGANAIAGEWGHNPLPWPKDSERPGRPCYCGKNGCIETFLSGGGMAWDHEAATGKKLTGPEIVALTESGDKDADATLGRYEERLARALATIINVLDPNMIVLGGGIGKIARLYQTLPQILPRYCFTDRVDTKIRPPKYGDSSGVRGAAWLWEK